jgi:flagellar FliL protein
MATITDSKRGAGKGDTTAKGSKDGKESGEQKKGMSKLVLIVAGVVIAAAIGGGVYFLFLKKPGPPPPPQPGAMVQMDAQTLTLKNGHFLKVQIAIQLVDGQADATTFETVKAAQLTIDTFSNLAVDELTSNAARKGLTATLLKGLQQAYPKEVYDVYLTQFVIQ